jgi:hypothetical protein
MKRNYVFLSYLNRHAVEARKVPTSKRSALTSFLEARNDPEKEKKGNAQMLTISSFLLFSFALYFSLWKNG